MRDRSEHQVGRTAGLKIRHGTAPLPTEDGVEALPESGAIAGCQTSQLPQDERPLQRRHDGFEHGGFEQPRLAPLFDAPFADARPRPGLACHRHHDDVHVRGVLGRRTDDDPRPFLARGLIGEREWHQHHVAVIKARRRPHRPGSSRCARTRVPRACRKRERRRVDRHDAGGSRRNLQPRQFVQAVIAGSSPPASGPLRAGSSQHASFPLQATTSTTWHTSRRNCTVRGYHDEKTHSWFQLLAALTAAYHREVRE
jgi:hypothetical protein